MPWRPTHDRPCATCGALFTPTGPRSTRCPTHAPRAVRADVVAAEHADTWGRAWAGVAAGIRLARQLARPEESAMIAYADELYAAPWLAVAMQAWPVDRLVARLENPALPYTAVAACAELERRGLGTCGGHRFTFHAREETAA